MHDHFFAGENFVCFLIDNADPDILIAEPFGAEVQDVVLDTSVSEDLIDMAKKILRGEVK